MDSLYSQKQITLDMEVIAKKHGKTKLGMFQPLLLARRMLTRTHTVEEKQAWIDQLKDLNSQLAGTEDEPIVYRVLAILYCKYELEIEKSNNYTADELMHAVGLDEVSYYNHFYDDEMRQVSLASKALDLLERKNRSLLEIAESKSVKPSIRIKAWNELSKYIDYCLMPQDDRTVNVYANQANIDASKGKQQINQFDVAALNGQGSKGFRDRLLKEQEGVETIDADN